MAGLTLCRARSSWHLMGGSSAAGGEGRGRHEELHGSLRRHREHSRDPQEGLKVDKKPPSSRPWVMIPSLTCSLGCSATVYAGPESARHCGRCLANNAEPREPRIQAYGQVQSRRVRKGPGNRCSCVSQLPPLLQSAVQPVGMSKGGCVPIKLYLQTLVCGPYGAPGLW